MISKRQTDRRRFRREPAMAEVVLESSSGEALSGRIRNFSPGGVFIELTEPSLVEQQRVMLRLDDGATVGIDPFFARVVRREADGVAIEFDMPHYQLAGALKKAGGQVQGAGENPEPLTESRRAELLRDLGAAVNEALAERLPRFVEDARERLIDEAEKAGSNTAQGVFFEAFTVLRKNADRLIQTIRDATDGHLDSFDELDFQVPGGGGGELSLVDEQAFETWLSESEIASAAESRFYNQLHALQSRLSVVREQRVDSRNNPLGPRALAHHAARALEKLALPPKALDIILRAFGRIVLMQLGELYERRNAHLVEAGVLPKLDRRVRRADRRAARRDAQTQDAQAEQGRADGASADAEQAPTGVTASSWERGQDASEGGRPSGPAGQPAGPGHPASTVIDLRQILSRRAGAVGGMPPYREPAGDARQLNLDELDDALRSLATERSGGPTYQRLEKRLEDLLRQRFEGSEERQLSRQQSDAVFLADELLTAMTADLVASEHGKQWIKRLEIPLLRLLLESSTVVEDPDHPARQLLNQLGQVHWRTEGMLSPRDSEAVQRIDGIVDRLAEREELTEVDLEAAAAEIESLLKRQQRRRESNTRRVLEAAEGRERLQSARDRVGRMVDQRLGGREVPRIVIDLLESGFKDLMALQALRAKEDPAELDESLSIFDRIESRLSGDGEAATADQDQALLAEVQARLERSGADPGAQRDVMDRLRNLLAGIGEEPDKVMLPRLHSETASEAIDTNAEADDLQIDPDQSFWLGRAKLMDVGSWLLGPDSEGRVRPLKLAWVSEQRDHYVFVDRDGHRALEITPAGVAEQLREDQATLADHRDEPLMDRSMQNIVQRMHDQIAHQATHDELTGLLNRKEFERRMKLKVSESKLIQSSHIAILIDMDQFRIINTTAGHDAGDHLLKDIARVLRENLPDGADLGRIGPDDFGVLLPRCDSGRGHEIANRLRAAVAEHNTGWKTRRLRVTASIGLVAISRDSSSVEEVMNRLEVACDAAKEEGDRVRSFEIDDTELDRRDMALSQVGQLEKALETGKLELLGQLIKPLTGEADGPRHYEILSRINDENGRAISADDFVSAAEAYGRIHFLDEAVLNRTFSLLADYAPSDHISRLAINISGKTFGRPRFVQLVQDRIKHYGIPPSKICFEITETAAMTNLSRCADVLRELRYMGCQFSLDDFGTGLASFGYLKHLPVDYLKIDGSFTREIGRSTADYGLVRTINEIGHLLGKKTVAEYVENEQVLNQLREIGLDYVQGFGIEKPRPLSDILSR